jgi:hypothetical protein
MVIQCPEPHTVFYHILGGPWFIVVVAVVGVLDSFYIYNAYSFEIFSCHFDGYINLLNLIIKLLAELQGEFGLLTPPTWPN